jgi:hypothetical protein
MSSTSVPNVAEIVAVLELASLEQPLRAPCVPRLEVGSERIQARGQATGMPFGNGPIFTE